MKRLYRVCNASRIKTASILDTPLSECSSGDFTLGPTEEDSIETSYFVRTAIDDGYDVPITVYYEYRNVYFRGVLVGRIGGAYDPDEDDSWPDYIEKVENIWENGYDFESHAQTIYGFDSWFRDYGIDEEFDELVEHPEDYCLNADSTLRDFFIVQEMDLEPFELLNGTTAAIGRTNHRSAKRNAMKKNNRLSSVRKRAEENPYGVQVGDIFVSTWGYDATLCDFYQVVRVSDKSVWVQEIGQTREYTGWNDWDAMPVPDSFRGEVERHKIQDGWNGRPYISIDSVRGAIPWNGKPVPCDNYH